MQRSASQKPYVRPPKQVRRWAGVVPVERGTRVRGAAKTNVIDTVDSLECVRFEAPKQT